MVRLVATLPGLFMLGSCYVPSQAGGYAAQCHLRDSSGWEVTSFDSLQQKIGSHIVDLSAQHLYTSTETAALIEVFAYSFTEYGTHEIYLDSAHVYLDFNGARYGALEELRENPFMKDFWKCGGQFSSSENLNRCGPAVLSFPKPIPPEQGFILHLESLRIDGKFYPVPDIEFCYIPRTTHWVKFHG